MLTVLTVLIVLTCKLLILFRCLPTAPYLLLLTAMALIVSRYDHCMQYVQSVHCAHYTHLQTAHSVRTTNCPLLPIAPSWHIVHSYRCSQMSPASARRNSGDTTSLNSSSATFAESSKRCTQLQKQVAPSACVPLYVRVSDPYVPPVSCQLSLSVSRQRCHRSCIATCNIMLCHQCCVWRSVQCLGAVPWRSLSHFVGAC